MPEVRHGTSPPTIPVSQPSVLNGTMGMSNSGSGIGPDSEAQSAVENGIGLTDSKIYKAVSGAGLKPPVAGIDKIEDGAANLEGVASTIKTMADNEGVQEIGKAVLNSVPALMKVLETMSKAHPFAQLAFEPFKWAYNQELKRRDNETTSRLALFESIKNVMLISIEMKDLVTSDDQRRDPAGHPVESRLVAVGVQMKEDIYGCYATLDAMQKQSLFIRFCNAAAWSKQLQGYKDNFKTRQNDLMMALTLYTATSIHSVPARIEDVIHEEFLKGPIVVKTSHDREIEAFYRARGGPEQVFKDENKCRELLKLQNELTGTHNIPSIVIGANKQRSGGVADPRGSSRAKDPKEGARDKEALNKLRKEWQTDVTTVIQENMESFKKYWDLSLYRLSEDINQNTHREVNRIIGSMIGQWHRRLNDKIMRQLWKDQGWRGNAKTRTLILALRDYFVERVEGTSLLGADGGVLSFSLVPSPPADDSDPQDLETAIGVPLPDSWMVDYLEAKRLRYLQQALDPDMSGLSTINEINSFTQSCPPGWSLPRWIAYWAMGWQIFATRYCSQIDEVFTQMVLVNEQVGISMPGNKVYINHYLLNIWPLVNSLTSGVERFDGSNWLAEQFQEYITKEETKLRSDLEGIRFHIDSREMVNELLTGNPIERSILMLLAIIMRRHLTKMHMYLTRELSDAELIDDMNTILYVVDVAWTRYCGIAETYRHQQTVDMDRNFEWFSCGLFRKYHEWKAWNNDMYYKTNEVFVPTGGSEIIKVEEKELKKILHDVISSASKETIPQTDSELHKCHFTELQEAISGTWFGFHCTEPEAPRSGMVRFDLEVSNTQDTTILTISGEGNELINGASTSIEGQVVATPGDQQQVPVVEFKHILSSGDYTYRGVLEVGLQVISGTFETPEENDGGTFFFKKTPRAEIMCHRPLHARLSPNELWSFACNAVVGALRRQRLSRGYLAARIKTIRRTLELLASAGHFRVPAAPAQAEELSRLIREFTVNEWTEVFRLSNWYYRVGDLQPRLWCDSCGEVIARSRVLCMDCKRPGDSIDFDNKEECITISTVVRDDLPAPHDRSHLLLKTRNLVLLNDYPSLERRARDCVTRAAHVFSTTIQPTSDPALPSTTPAPEETRGSPDQTATDQVPNPDNQDSSSGSDASKNDDKHRGLNCLICKKPVSAPYDDAFVCLSCEKEIDDLLSWDFQRRYREEAKSPTKHNVFHVLMRFSNLSQAIPSQNAVLNEEEIDRRLHALEQRLLGRMEEDKTQLVARLAKIEAHLQALVANLDV
ncbi:hypothetical protein MSAN_01142100 [Mycena sanguinolenta]|uniref:Uncharacterized protein n=1 Tax=Mycena sanguinolenta TaxID=230812 RepID=A0A8H7D4F9_9AGAR|nr:hypothetical protein MSAN_01142100 [Mycena sanguinolenta]